MVKTTRKTPAPPGPILSLRCGVCKTGLGSQLGLEIDDDWMDEAWEAHLEKRHL